MEYRKKPVVIEAFRLGYDNTPAWFMEKVDDETVEMIVEIKRGVKCVHCIVKTLEGKMRGNEGDYIIIGLRGELYPCKPDIFEQSYEAVKDRAAGESKV